MSQYPQVPPPPYPGGQGPALPPGYPGGPGYGAPMGPPPGNGLAVGALVCGILGCVPVVNLVAICLGVAGIKRAGRIGGRGRGMAVAGLVLGLLFLLVSGGGLTWYFLTAAKYRDLSHQFITAMADGDTTKAAALSHSTMSRANLDGPSAALRTLGKLKDVTVEGHDFKTGTDAHWTVTGKSTFDARTLDFMISFQDEAGTPKVVQYWFK